MFEKILDFFLGDLTAEQWKFLRSFGWRIVVGFHMAYACGYLAMLGLPLQGFAQAQDVAALQVELAQQKEASVLQARLGIVREIRIQSNSMCTTNDATIRAALLNTIDRLREDYWTITKEIYPEIRCP